MKVIIEIKISKGLSEKAILDSSTDLEKVGLNLDKAYKPVHIKTPERDNEKINQESEDVYCIRGEIDEKLIPELEKLPNVISVCLDTPIAPFNQPNINRLFYEQSAVNGVCPIPPCDCQPSVPKGRLVQILGQIGVVDIWKQGFMGEGIVIGIVDGGIKALGRVPDGKLGRVIGGWPADWGTRADWNEHGMMTATDAMVTAAKSELYDIRISDAGSITGVISNALAGFEWAIQEHRASGRPLVLSNSWGIYRESWDPNYARNPNHIFTRKVVEALNEGILVLFSAGNCGGTCPDNRCGSDIGPGKSIWGANGHTGVMTVGAVNSKYEFIGYSSEGPAALDHEKPDFCSISHFTGYFNSDTGTSAACPVAAGVVALLKQVNQNLSQNDLKQLIKQTAYDIGPAGWDIHSGAGIMQPYEAYKKLIQANEVVFQNLHDGGWLLGGAQILAQVGKPANEIRELLVPAKAHVVASGGFKGAGSLMDSIINNPNATMIWNVISNFQSQLRNRTCLKNKKVLVQHIFNTGIQLGWAQWGSSNGIPKANIMENLRVSKLHADALGPSVYSTMIVYITRAMNKLQQVPNPIQAHSAIADARTKMYGQLAGKKCFISK
jgi:hypothetical protein